MFESHTCAWPGYKVTSTPYTSVRRHSLHDSMSYFMEVNESNLVRYSPVRRPLCKGDYFNGMLSPFDHSLFTSIYDPARAKLSCCLLVCLTVSKQRCSHKSHGSSHKSTTITFWLPALTQVGIQEYKLRDSVTEVIEKLCQCCQNSEHLPSLNSSADWDSMMVVLPDTLQVFYSILCNNHHPKPMSAPSAPASCFAQKE